MKALPKEWEKACTEACVDMSGKGTYIPMNSSTDLCEIVKVVFGHDIDHPNYVSIGEYRFTKGETHAIILILKHLADNLPD